MRLLAFYGSLILSLIVTSQVLGSANHSSGLHLQLPGQVIDIKPSSIEESQIVPLSPVSALVMITLKPDFAEKLKKQTQKAIGQTALWVWNGRVVGAETLKAPLGKDLTVPNLTAFEADLFMKQ